MKKLKFIIFLLVCTTLLLTNCVSKTKNNTTTKNKSADSVCKIEIYNDIERHRIIYEGKDSLVLWPFELFSVMKLKQVSIPGLYGSLEFEMDNGDSTIVFIDVLNKYTYDGGFKDDLWTGKKVILELKTIEGILKREIIKGEKYKVIYAYSNDSEVLRTNIPTEHACGFYIVDIIKLNEKFQRQIPYL